MGFTNIRLFCKTTATGILKRITGTDVSSDKRALDVIVYDSVGTAINAALAANQPVPEHKTHFLYGTTSGQTDDLTPATGKRIRVYGFYGAYTVNAAYNPSADGSLSFGTGGLTDRSKILGASGQVAGARTMIFTMTPLNRLGAVNEIIRFTMATFDAGTAAGNFVILYKEE